MTQTVERPPTPSTSTPLSRWLRLGRIAALVVAAWAATLQTLAGHVIPPVLAIGVGFIGLAAMLSRPGRRTGLIAAGVAAIALFGNAPEVVAQFSRPSSALEFVLNVFVTSSVAVIVVAGVAAFKGGRPSQSAPPDSAGWEPLCWERRSRWSPRPVSNLPNPSPATFG